MKKIFIVIALLIIFLMVYFGYKYTQKPVASLSKIKADFALGNDELSSAFCHESNISESERNYAGKIIEVRGKIASITESGIQPATIILEQHLDCPAIAITMEQNFNNEIHKLEPEKDVVIRARCTGLLLEVILTDGVLIKVHE